MDYIGKQHTKFEEGILNLDFWRKLQICDAGISGHFIIQCTTQCTGF